ncbi:unnamed protein product [Leptidea sinapis]|uniref:Mediator of RNA polymerase II transcription subunit 29 n=1 Tax=Leptidea sinapis TaxID=189913 RepID=A0A5E4QZY7_9NEOP|nr:unnamed protein product [Leptidea sinapis]
MNQMNMHVPMNPGGPMGPASNVAMQLPVSGPIMQQPSPQQMQPALSQQTQQEKLDNISKVKTLMGSLRESLPRTAITCIQQAQSAAHYLPLTVIPTRMDSGPITQETTLSYPQYLNTVRLQISYAKDIHDTLVAAAQNISPTE